MNKGLLDGALAGEAPYVDRYALLYWEVPEGTEGGGITAGVWKNCPLNRIVWDPDELIEKVVAGTVFPRMGRYRIRAVTQSTQHEGCAGRIQEVASGLTIAQSTMFTGTAGRLTSTMTEIDDEIVIRRAGGIRFDIYSTSVGNGAGWATGMAYGSGTTGLPEVHALMELWEVADS